MRFLIQKFRFISGRQLLMAAAVSTFAVGVPFADTLLTQGKIYPGVSFASVEIGGKTKKEARTLLTEHTQEFLGQPLTFVFNDQQAAIPLQGLMNFDIDQIVETAYVVGRREELVESLQEKITARLKNIELGPKVEIQSEHLEQLLANAFVSAATPPEDAQLLITFTDNNPAISIREAREGTVFDLENAKELIRERAASLSTEPVNLRATAVTPALQKSDIEPLLPAVQALLGQPQPQIKFQSHTWTIPYATLASWINVQKQEGAVELKLNREGIKEWLNNLAKDIERRPQDGLMELAPDQNRVLKFQIGRPGLSFPREENAALIETAILERQIVELRAEITPPRITLPENANLFGIQELVGKGTTNFKGSPVNRIKNIKRGAQILNGLLIEPGQEFSLLEALRPFTTENGYLPELVIKAAEGRTVPEIGGGLCQIGTTMFRTVLNAGLPIVARANHSYRVSYYEPPVGMDATIYDPAPDFKFVNDTGAWLLLLTHVEGSNLTFELWGTKDGRRIEISEPAISNIRRPPEKKIVETTTLAPGKIKCTEKAHVGSDARFTYTVAYADGRVETKEFFSRYRPWQEVCLVGVAPPVAEAPTASETVPLSTSSDTLPSADVVGVIGDENTPPPQQ